MKFTRLDMRKHINDKKFEHLLAYHLYKLQNQEDVEIVYKRINGDLKALRVFDTEVIRRELAKRQNKHTEALLALMDNIEGDNDDN